MNEVLIGVEEIQFDCTFYTVPIQFYQLWTVFASIGGHVIPCIHCLLAGKQETLYTEVLRKIRELVPQLQPIRGMSDWEKAPRNSLKIVFEGIHLQGCLFQVCAKYLEKVTKTRHCKSLP